VRTGGSITIALTAKHDALVTEGVQSGSVRELPAAWIQEDRHDNRGRSRRRVQTAMIARGLTRAAYR
jgi:hypothetical protein